MKSLKYLYGILLILFISFTSCNSTETRATNTRDSTINNSAANKDRILPDSSKSHSSESGALGTMSDGGKKDEKNGN